MLDVLSNKKTALAAAGGLAAIGVFALLMAHPALAQTVAAPAAAAAAAPAAPPPPVPNKGDTAWMLVATALVLMMSIPGLGLFYGGLVRTKNMLSVLSQVFMIVSMVGIVWVVYGYSMALGDTPQGGWSWFIGGFGKKFLMGITPSSIWGTFTPGVYIPELVYMVFQMTFAMITPALIVGAFAERMKFSAVVAFMLLWVTFIYFPIAHWVWATPTPDDIVGAAKELAAATTDAAKKAAQDKLDGIMSGAGWLWSLGALDFAGGTVVHINAGIAGLVGCLMIGKRVGLGKETMAPHSLVMSWIGASMLWVGWFGFNAGSNLEANGVTALAFVNTMVATAAAALSWMVFEWVFKGKPSMLGMASGAVAGLVAVTPASGFAGPMGAVVLGLVVSPVCLFFVSSVKSMFGYDDALDVFGVHCIGGIIGALGTGILVAPYLGGTGLTDYTAKDLTGTYNMGTQLWIQFKAVASVLIWSGVGSAVIYALVGAVIGLRVKDDAEREGLDVIDHGERAYNS